MSLKTKKIIFEQAYAGGDIQLIEESVTPGGQYKCIFRAKLQEADVVNNNKRVYPVETLEEVYNQLKEKALARKLVGELDHPQPQGDQSSKIKRSSTISLEKACILIKDVEWDGNSIYGICETLSNRSGMDLYCLLKDKVTIGFSLRAFGETKNRGGGVVEVVARGIKALTYDVVANPSHDSSVILEILQEGSNSRDLVQDLKANLLEEQSKIQDGNILIEETYISNQINEKLPKKVCVGNICSIAPLEEAIEYILDQIVSDTNIPSVKVKQL
jgi:hypothetical protein